MTRYYNAIVKTDYGAAITYHEITTVKAFIENMNKAYSVETIYFYRLASRTDKRGEYCGKWTVKDDLVKYHNW